MVPLIVSKPGTTPELLADRLLGTGRVAMIHEAIRYRDEQWNAHGIALENAGLDLFTTDIPVAGQCCRDMFETMRTDGANPTQYRWIEPSAGKGPFLKRLPPDTIALDVLPWHPNVVRVEFLTWRPPHRDRYAIVGSPPFGIRARQSIPFLNHALDIADYVGMIVPRFMTKGKINGRLIRSRGLDVGAMRDLSGNALSLKLEWQVWGSRRAKHKPEGDTR